MKHLNNAKTGVLVVNLGTPDSPQTKDVRRYLREFLSDWRVIDINPIGRWLLVNLIIAPFRGPKSAAEYKKVWTDKGSPLLINGVEATEKLKEKLGDDYVVSFGMRYQNPTLKSALEPLKNKGLKEIIVLPLYPQYASATTGSTIEAFYRELLDWQIIPDIRVISNYPNHEAFIKAWVEISKPYLEKENYDHYVFSYHGLPERQIRKGSTNNHCKLGECCNSYHKNNQFCYRAQCFETTRHIAKHLNIPEEKYTVCFQSRLGKDPWVQPYTEEVVQQLAKEGKKKVLAFSPAFTSDCLETTLEVGETYAEEFIEAGGEQWDLVESLNTNEHWIECLSQMVKEAQI